MKILGVVGSARRDGQTNRLVRTVLDHMQIGESSIEADLIHTAGLDIAPCRVVCADFCKRNPYQCSITDAVPEIFEKMRQADALVIGAPQYFRGPPADFYTMAERMVSMCFFPESQGGAVFSSPLAGKPCGLVAVAEYSNPQGILEYLNDFCLLLGMKPVSIDSFPHFGVGGHGDIDGDGTFRPLDRARELGEALLHAVSPDPNATTASSV